MREAIVVALVALVLVICPPLTDWPPLIDMNCSFVDGLEECESAAWFPLPTPTLDMVYGQWHNPPGK